MKYLNTYKIFESMKDTIKDRISVIKDFLSELSDNEFNIKCEPVQNGTRLIAEITKDDKNKFHWNDIKDEVLRLIDLCDDNGLIFRHMGYTLGKSMFGDKIKTFETDEILSLVYLVFDISYADDKYFYLDTHTIDDYLYSLGDNGSSPINDVNNNISVRVETTNIFVSVLGKEHEIMGVCNIYIRGNDEGYKWEDVKNELIKVQDTVNKMTNNFYSVRVGSVKDVFNNYLVDERGLSSNTIENVDSKLGNVRIKNMEIIIRHTKHLTYND